MSGDQGTHAFDGFRDRHQLRVLLPCQEDELFGRLGPHEYLSQQPSFDQFAFAAPDRRVNCRIVVGSGGYVEYENV